MKTYKAIHKRMGHVEYLHACESVKEAKEYLRSLIGEYGADGHPRTSTSERAAMVSDYTIREIPEESTAAARALGRKGGSARSERKAAASRANGRRGGRPRGVLTTRSRIEARWTSDPAGLENRAPIPGSPEAVGSPRQVFAAVRDYKRTIGSAFCRVEYRHRGRILTRTEIEDLETAVMLAEQESRE